MTIFEKYLKEIKAEGKKKEKKSCQDHPKYREFRQKIWVRFIY